MADRKADVEHQVGRDEATLILRALSVTEDLRTDATRSGFGMRPAMGHPLREGSMEPTPMRFPPSPLQRERT